AVSARITAMIVAGGHEAELQAALQLPLDHVGRRASADAVADHRERRAVGFGATVFGKNLDDRRRFGPIVFPVRTAPALLVADVMRAGEGSVVVREIEKFVGMIG